MKASYLHKSQPMIWVVDSEYTGERNARLGLAQRLGFRYDLIPVPQDGAAYWRLLKSKYARYADYPPLLIISGTGEETTAEIADLPQHFPATVLNVFLASILPEDRHPRLAEYDLIASPQLSGDNIVTLTCVPNQLTRQNLDTAYLEHADYFNGLAKPVTALLVGGNTRYCSGFTPDHARQLGERIARISAQLGGTLIISNSRRTPEDAQSALLEALNGVNYDFFDWQTMENNFYPAMLAHAELFIVTGDSLSMCSEAAFTGKPLLIDLSREATECFHREIIGRLIDHGAAKLLGDPFEPWAYEPIDPTGMVAEEIKKRFGEILHFA